MLRWTRNGLLARTVSLGLGLLLTHGLLAAQSSLAAWGEDGDGQVSGAPTGAGFLQVGAGDEHSVALREDGSLVSWGSNFYGQVSTTPGGQNFTQVSAGGNHSVALRSDGSVAAWGHILIAQNAPSASVFQQVSGGGWHCLALRNNGAIVAWGNDLNGEVALTPTGADYVQVAGGRKWSLALREDGSIEAWGDDFDGIVSEVPPGNDFIQITAGRWHALALRADGSIAEWGYGSVIPGTPQGSGYVQVAAGVLHSSALHADGSVVSWGVDDVGQVSGTPAGSTFSFLSAGGSHSLAVGVACDLALASQQVERLGAPANPSAFLPGQTSGPVIGTTWDPVVEHATFVTDAIADFVLITGAPANTSLGPAGTLLCDFTSGTFGFATSPAPGVPFSLPVANQCALIGEQVCVQGGSVDSSAGVHLANALDVTIGSF